MSGIRRTQKSRMDRISRTLLAAVVMAALLAALTGCGGGSAPSSTATKPPASGSTASSNAPATTEATTAATAEEAAIAMGVTPIDEAEARQLVRKGARLINVDTKAASNAERIKGAKQVPLSKLVDAAGSWSTSKPVVVTSATQARSMVGASYLAREGFTEVYYLFDGHDGWTGSYAGDSPRKPTDPVLCYYIYRSDYPDETVETVMQELEEQFEALEDKYDRIDFELIDGSVSLSKAYEVLRKYNVKRALLPDGSVDYVIPQWILVDSNGEVTMWNTYIHGPIELVVPTIHGFVYKNSE